MSRGVSQPVKKSDLRKLIGSEAVLPILVVASVLVAWQFLVPLAGAPAYILPPPRR